MTVQARAVTVQARRRRFRLGRRRFRLRCCSGTGGGDSGTGGDGSGTGGDGSGTGGDSSETGGDGSDTGGDGSDSGGDGSDSGAGSGTGGGDSPDLDNLFDEPLYPYILDINDDGQLTLDIRDENEQSLLNGMPFTVSGRNKDEIEDFLGEWFPGEIDDAEIFSIAAMSDFINRNNQAPTDINQALRRAINITSIMFNDFKIEDGQILQNIDWSSISESGDIPAGSVINVEDLISIYSGDEYLYDFAKAAISQDAFGGNGQSNIATRILDFVEEENLVIPESLSLIDASIMEILGLDNKPFDTYSVEKQQSIESLTKIYLNNISGIIGNDVILGDYGVATTINLGQWLPKAEKASDKKLFAFAASDDLHLRGEVNFQNRIGDIVNKSEDHALVLGAADHVEISKGAKIHFEGSNLGIGAYSSLTLNEVSIETGGNLAIGSLEDLHITSTSSLNADKYSVFRVGKIVIVIMSTYLPKIY